METMLEKCANEKLHSVVHFLWAKGLNAKDIHTEMFPVYSGKCLSCKVVHNWAEKFSQGCLKVADDGQTGRPVEIATEATMQQVEELIQANSRQCSNCTKMLPWFNIQHNV
jgi:hypothetical protein